VLDAFLLVSVDGHVALYESVTVSGLPHGALCESIAVSMDALGVVCYSRHFKSVPLN